MTQDKTNKQLKFLFAKIKMFLPWAIRLGVAILFAASGLLKLRKSAEYFADVTASYQVLPSSAIHFLVVVLPVFEIAVAVLLLVPKFWRVGTVLASGLCALFLFALAQTVVRGIDLRYCGCFGAGGEGGVASAIFKNLLLLAFLCTLFFTQKATDKTSSPRKKAFLPVVAIVAVLLSIFGAFLFNAFREKPLEIFGIYKTPAERLKAEVKKVRRDGNFHKQEALARAKAAGADVIISKEEMLNVLQEKSDTALLVDAGTDFYFAREHLPNAINISVENFSKDFKSAEKKITSAKRIIVYCDGGDCIASKLVARALRDSGVNAKIEIFDGDFRELLLYQQEPISPFTPNGRKTQQYTTHKKIV
jgi:rhodanese-related sulfurtransferase/uncharacterized membrane protein YphA (DoxX/SURF4 family)